MHSTLTSLLLVALVAATPPPPADDCSTTQLSQTFANGVTCTGVCKGDRHGGDYGNAYAGNFLKCAQICAAEPLGKCLSAQYNEGNGYCYLKGVINNLDTASTNTDTWDCCPGPQTYTTSTGSVTCTPKCGTDRQGGDYARTQTNSFGQCIQLCGADPNCVTAQYHNSNGYCYFKNVVNAPNTDLGVQTVDCVASSS